MVHRPATKASLSFRVVEATQPSSYPSVGRERRRIWQPKVSGHVDASSLAADICVVRSDSLCDCDTSGAILALPTRLPSLPQTLLHALVWVVMSIDALLLLFVLPAKSFMTVEVSTLDEHDLHELADSPPVCGLLSPTPERSWLLRLLFQDSSQLKGPVGVVDCYRVHRPIRSARIAKGTAQRFICISSKRRVQTWCLSRTTSMVKNQGHLIPFCEACQAGSREIQACTVTLPYRYQARVASTASK